MVLEISSHRVNAEYCYYKAELPGVIEKLQYTKQFDQLLQDCETKAVVIPPKSPNLNPHAERFVRAIKEECLNRMMLFTEDQMRYVVKHYSEHYHHERNHQGLDCQCSTSLAHLLLKLNAADYLFLNRCFFLNSPHRISRALVSMGISRPEHLLW